MTEGVLISVTSVVGIHLGAVLWTNEVAWSPDGARLARPPAMAHSARIHEPPPDTLAA